MAKNRKRASTSAAADLPSSSSSTSTIAPREPPPSVRRRNKKKLLKLAEEQEEEQQPKQEPEKESPAKEREDPRVEIMYNYNRVGGRNDMRNVRIRRRTSRTGMHPDEHDSWWFNRLVSFVMVATVVSIVAYFAYVGFLETRVSTPIPVDKVVQKTGLDVPERFWGTYRPGVYFGMKHRHPTSLLTGIMWLSPSTIQSEGPKLRHLCQQDDKLKRYGWVEHDGVNFGVQEIVDKRLDITTSFVKRQGGENGGDWTQRVEVKPHPNNLEMGDETVLFFYVAKEGTFYLDAAAEFDPQGDMSGIRGYSAVLGNFNIRFENSSKPLSVSTFTTQMRSVNDISQTALGNLGIKTDTGRPLFTMKKQGVMDRTNAPNLILYMVHVKGRFTLDIIYESESFVDRPGPLSGSIYTQHLNHFRSEFQKNFESKFHLKEKGFNATHTKFAQAALSNMVGGIGYFYGHSRVMGPYQQAPIAYWNSGLYTAVPSRSFFPRGFLWDEGFHLLLINKWNPDISIDIISHWLDLMNTEGWIPREQILGEEALSRVPEEFVVQKNDVANPPTLLMGLFDLIERHREYLLATHKTTLQKMWPRLQAWYQWLNRTQSGEEPTSFRWKGRNETTVRELNPKTLPSGLDDYPRASHPTKDERHLDLRCWMAMCSKLMAELASILELDFDYDKYVDSYNTLTNPELLDKLHWSEQLQSYADYGLHSDNIVLQYPPQTPGARNQHQRPEKIRYVSTPPKYGFVNMFGYGSLFPLSLQILSPDSPKLVPILEKLEDPKHLWTPYGLRSLSASAPVYQKRNTEHDPPYWRGAVWININFLTLKALKSYSQVTSPAGILAQSIHAKLRENLINNVVSEYYKTGYIWEQYDDSTGMGKGCRPFTGWSALVVLIMAEEY